MTRNGEDAVVVAAADCATTGTPPVASLADLLARSPLADVELDLARPRDTGRRVRL